MTLKDLVYKILLDKPETRESYKKLIWKVWDYLGFVTYTTEDMGGEIKYHNFMESPSPESIRRPAQQIFRSDKLMGENKVQPTRRTKKIRQILANENGFSYIVGKQPVYNPEKGVYEI
jgi:hypothetical protein